MKNEGSKYTIAKNSILLYIRMLVVMIVTFYTTRISLQILGIEDFGIRNVVGGIIGFASVITTAMVNAAQRFLAYDIGKNDFEHFERTFSMLINIFVIFSVIGFFLLELIGPYFINRQMVLASNRIFAAQVVFQLTTLAFIFQTIVIPHTSAIIAYEKMNVFAYITIVDAVLKLLVVYLLKIISFDKLITFAALTTVAQVVTSLLYVLYCRFHIKGCRFRYCWDKSILNKLLSFMGWNLFGSATSVMNIQGQSLLLNIFFGPLVNAAKAIADNVNSLALQFINSFYMAIGPQIVKSYANKNYDYTREIVLKGTKFAFFLISIISVPIMFNVRQLLNLWLGADQVTDMMVIFSIWVLIQSMVQVMDYPITQTVRATGNIRSYQICVGVQTLLFIPLCYIFFKMGAQPQTSMVILTFLYGIVQIYRVWKLSTILNIRIKDYYKFVVLPILLVIIISTSLIYIIDFSPKSIFGLIISIIISFSIVLICTLIFGVSKSERNLLINEIQKIKHK